MFILQSHIPSGPDPLALGIVSRCVMVFLSGFVVVFLLTPVVRTLASRFGILDLPDGDRRIHKKPIPRGGGFAVIIGFYIAGLVAYYFRAPYVEGSLDAIWGQAFLSASVILLLVGLADDLWGVPPWLKCAGQWVAATVMFFMSGQGFHVLFGYEMPPLLDYVVTMIWFLAIINAFNLIDGLDGLASGLAIIGAVGLGASFIFRGLPNNVLVTMALAGSCLAFLRYNFSPATIFLGDTGSMFLGFTLAAIAVGSGGKSTFLASVGVPLLAVGIPLFDTILAMWRRSVRMLFPRVAEVNTDVGITHADKEHLHHRFLGKGLTQRDVAIILYAINALLVILGISMLVFKAQSVGIFLIAFVIGVYVIVRHLANVELWDTGLAIMEGLSRPTRKMAATLLYPVWDLFWLSLSLVLTIRLCNVFWVGHGGGGEWVRQLPVWITPVFLCLFFGKTYSRVWSVAGFGDYMVLQAVLFAGVLFSMGFAVLMEDDTLSGVLRRGVLFGGLCFPGIIVGRVWVRLFQELMITMVKHRKNGVAGQASKRALLYGAGRRCVLFLTERTLQNPRIMSQTSIVGLVDDDTNMRLRYVGGLQVLGTRGDLSRLIKEYQIEQIIITTDMMDKKAWLELLSIAEQHSIKLLQWYSSERAIYEPAVDPLTHSGGS